MGHALTTIVRQEGVPALYRGLNASILAIIPEAAITYGAAPSFRCPCSDNPRASPLLWHFWHMQCMRMRCKSKLWCDATRAL